MWSRNVKRWTKQILKITLTFWVHSYVQDQTWVSFAKWRTNAQHFAGEAPFLLTHWSSFSRHWRVLTPPALFITAALGWLFTVYQIWSLALFPIGFLPGKLEMCTQEEGDRIPRVNTWNFWGWEMFLRVLYMWVMRRMTSRKQQSSCLYLRLCSQAFSLFFIWLLLCAR